MGEETETSSPKSPKDDFKTKLIHEEMVWIDYAVQQAQIAQKTIQDSLDSAISFAQSRFNQIRDTSAAHLSVTAVRFYLFFVFLICVFDIFFAK